MRKSRYSEVDQWLYQRGVELAFIRPRRPIENCFVESFNGRLRDECLNTHWFLSLRDARRRIEAWPGREGQPPASQIKPSRLRGGRKREAQLPV